MEEKKDFDVESKYKDILKNFNTATPGLEQKKPVAIKPLRVSSLGLNNFNVAQNEINAVNYASTKQKSGEADAVSVGR